MKFMKKLMRNKGGYSLVELIVTIAILTVIAGGISAAVVSATRNYSRGTTEVSVQATGQNVTNILTNLIIDSAQAYSASDGVTQGVGPDLYIKDVAGKCYGVRYVAGANPVNGTGYIYYGEGDDYATAGASTLILADNVVGFEVDTTNYSKNYTVHVTLKLNFPSENREYTSSFTVTSRNAAADNSYIDNLDGAVIISDTMVLIEPNESTSTKPSLSVDCTVITSGTVTSGITYSLKGSQNSAAADINGAEGLTVSYDVANARFTFDATENLASHDFYVLVQTTAIDPSTGLPYDSKWITVYVRKVVSADITKDTTLSTKSTNTANSVHAINGSIDILNPSRYYSIEADNDYGDVYTGGVAVSDVIWQGTIKSGTSYTDYISSILNEDGIDVKAQVFSTEGYKATSGDILTVKLAKDLPKSEVITFTLDAVHPMGTSTHPYYSGKYTNKASKTYGTKKEYYCDFAIYRISSGLFGDISDYQRGNTDFGGKTGFGNMTAAGIFNDSMQDIYKDYLKKKDSDALDPYGNSYKEVYEWLEKWRTDQISPSVAYFYRLKDYTYEGGTKKETDWSQYRVMGTGTNFSFLGTEFVNTSSVDSAITNRLNGSCYQSVEWIGVVYSGDEILWPYYPDLLTYGFGNGGEHNNGLNWHFNKYAESITGDYPLYASKFDVVPGSIEYKEAPIFDVTSKTYMIGTTSEPKILGSSMNYGYLYYNKIDWVGLHFNAFQNYISGTLMVKEPGKSWEVVTKYGKGPGLPNPYICDAGGFRLDTTDEALRFDTQGVSISSAFKKDNIYRVIPTIANYKLGYIDESEGVFSKKVYFDDAHTITFYLTDSDIYSDSVKSAITFKRTGNAKTIRLIPGEGATCSQESISFTPGEGTSLPTPTKPGFTFMGWYTTAAEVGGGVKVTSSTTDISVNTLWARWVDPTVTPYDVEETSASMVSCDVWVGGVNYKQAMRYVYTVSNYTEAKNLAVSFVVSSDAIRSYNGTSGTFDGTTYTYSSYVQTGGSYQIVIELVKGSVIKVDE